MEATFRIAEPSDQTTGDHVSFVIHDRDGAVPARISGTALRILAGTASYDRLDVFKANAEKIRQAAYNSRRGNPTLAMVSLGAVDFGG